MRLGCSLVALLALVWSAACAPIGCPIGRVPLGEQCVCPEGTKVNGIPCSDDRGAPAGDGGSADPVGRLGDGGERTRGAPSDDGGAPSREDVDGATAPAPRPDAGQSIDDAGPPDAPAPPRPEVEDRTPRNASADETPVPPPPPEPTCAERCASKQCDGAGRCLECVSDRDCQAAAPHCGANHRCLECTSSAQCAAGMRCGDDNACVRTGCGDGRRDPGEECDDGNDNPSDGCFGCVASKCGDGQINGTDQCEAAVGWLTSAHCQDDCTFRHFRLCESDESCPGGRCFRGVCAPMACTGIRQNCEGFSYAVQGNDHFCPGLPENAPRLVDGHCVLRCNAGTCPATLTCIDNSYCAARR